MTTSKFWVCVWAIGPENQPGTKSFVALTWQKIDSEWNENMCIQ